MTTPPPEHSGLRPLGPYGEGYCRVCHFVVGLTADGGLETHQRTRTSPYGVTADGACKGAGKTPPKITPLTSRLAAFKVKATKIICPLCNRVVELMPDGRVPGHTTAYHTTTPCKGGWQQWSSLQQRDRGSERG